MPIRLAFCDTDVPGVPVDALRQAATTWGFDGVVVMAVYGDLDERAWALPVGAGRPGDVRSTEEAAVAPCARGERSAAIPAIHSGLSLVHASPEALAGSKLRLRALIKAASQWSVANVIVRGGRTAGRLKTAALQQCAEALRELAEEAARRRVRLLFENAGDLAASQDAWFLRDAVDSPAMGYCWNVRESLRAGETPSLALPRLSAGLAMVWLSDVPFGEGGAPLSEIEVAGVRADVPRMIELLKGVAFEGWICVVLSDADAPHAETRLPAAAAWLRAEIDRKVVELSAYKGDKQKPRFAARGRGDVPRGAQR